MRYSFLMLALVLLSAAGAAEARDEQTPLRTGQEYILSSYLQVRPGDAVVLSKQPHGQGAVWKLTQGRFPEPLAKVARRWGPEVAVLAMGHGVHIDLHPRRKRK